MSRRPTRAPGAPRPTQGASALSKEEPTQPALVAEGRGTTLSRESAQAIADASEASGFPPPPQVQAVLAAPTIPETPADDAATSQEA